MRLVLTEPRFLKEGINILSELVNEVRFKVDENKMELIAMDPANVAMVVFKLLGSAFAEYDAGGGGEIAINLENLKQVLRRVKPSDTVTLELDKERNKLKVQLSGDNIRVFNLALIDADEQEHKIPDLDFPLQIQMSSSVLDEAIEDVSVASESVAMLVDKGKFVINSEGNMSAAKVEVSSVSVENESDICAKYSLEYLKKMVKGSKLSESVSVQFNRDYPLKLEYNVLNKMQLLFILAPRVSND